MTWLRTNASNGTGNFQLFRQQVQSWLYRLTDGILGYHFTWDSLGGREGPGRILLLTTTERATGIVNTIPLTYFPDGYVSQDIFVLAFHRGSGLQPTWYLNLKSNPQAEIQIKARHQHVTGTIATTEERDRLFAQFTPLVPNYARYQHGTSREVPIALLHLA